MTIKHLSFDDSAYLTFGSLSTFFQPLLVLTDDIDVLFLFNTTDIGVTFSIPSGLVRGTLGYKNIRLPARSSIAIDCRTNSKRIAKGIISVSGDDSTPTTGEVTATGCR